MFKFFREILNRNSKNLLLKPFGNVQSKYISIDSKDDILLSYILVPTITAIINRKSELFSKANFTEINKKGEQIIESEFLNVINNPHPFYSGNEFKKTIAKQLFLFQEVFIYVNRKNTGAFIEDGDTFLVLPAQDVEIKVKKDFDIKEIKEEEDYLNGYIFNFKNKKIFFYPDEILHWTSTSLKSDSFEHADMNFKSIEKPINTILSAYNIVNGLYNRNGGFGILTNNSKGPSAEMYNNNIKNKEKEQLQKEIRDYSFNTDEYNMIISNASLKYQPITYPLSNMQLSDNFLQAKKDICDALIFDILTLNNIQGATYANLETADKKIYTDAIIPAWEMVESGLNSAKLSINKIKLDYSHIEALQGDKKNQIEATQLNDNLWINRFEKGTVTYNQMLVGMELIEVAGGDYYLKIQQNEN